MTDETKAHRCENADAQTDTESAPRPLTDEERALIKNLGLDPECACIAGGLVLDLSV